MSAGDWLIVVQISDLHITRPGTLLEGGVDTPAALEQCLAKIQRTEPRPHVLLATGDLVESGDPVEYTELRRQLDRMSMPVRLLPGNHDDRDALRAAFQDHAYLQQRPFVQYAIDDYAARIVVLDTLIPGQPGGRLDDERLRWLDATLASKPQKPTLVAMHHPPFHTGIQHMDAMALEDPGALADVLSRHSQVERVICGHVHRAIEASIAGIPVSVCPGPAHQIELDLRDGAPCRLVLEPPAYRLHLWRPDIGFVSHVAYVGDHAAYEF
jgi:3',5'-cyclic AMP phosphodiesterase CpdA